MCFTLKHNTFMQKTAECRKVAVLVLIFLLLRSKIRIFRITYLFHVKFNMKQM